MLERLQAALSQGRRSTEYGECRRCGTEIEDRDVRRCPDCGSDEIACYTF